MTDRCAKLRKQKRCHCNSVSNYFLYLVHCGNPWTYSSVFLTRFHQFYQKDFILALVLFSSYLFIFETYIHIFSIGENRPMDVGDIE